MKKIILAAFILSASLLDAQPWMHSMDTVSEPTFFQIRDNFNAYWQNKEVVKGNGYNVFKRWEWFWSSRVDSLGHFPPAGIEHSEWNNYKISHSQNVKNISATPTWAPMGPYSTPGGYEGLGRVNCVAFHPTNANIFWVGT